MTIGLSLGLIKSPWPWQMSSRREMMDTKINDKARERDWGRGRESKRKREGGLTVQLKKIESICTY